MEELIRQREQFENDLYDFLINPLIPPNFWDPVFLSIDINLLGDLYITQECVICIEEKKHHKELKCCKQMMCIDCSKGWFSKSTKCPYCNRCIIEFI